MNGKKYTADAACLRESILKPAANVRQGFNNPDVGMPPYEGILSDSQVESVILYLLMLKVTPPATCDATVTLKTKASRMGGGVTSDRGFHDLERTRRVAAGAESALQ